MDINPFKQGLALLRSHISKLKKSPCSSGDALLLEEAYRYLLGSTLTNIMLVGDYFPDGIALFGADGEILYVNRANERMFSIKWDDCVGHYAQSFADDGLWISGAITHEVFQCHKSYTCVTVPKRTGYRLLEIGAPIFDTDGQFEGALVIDRDISEAESLRENLENMQNRLISAEEACQIQSALIQKLSQQLHNQGGYIYDSPVMNELVSQALQIAGSDATVLITGETGSGKEGLADLIQSHSSRWDKPYIKVNCAALPEHVLESELFGYECGAFANADPKSNPGMFELANGGTILLDEIAELSLAFQAKLLRVLQNRHILRLGGTKTVELNVRIIVSTNRNLREMVSSGNFREDLYYRVNVLPLNVPPLRSRSEDIDILTRFFLKRFNRKYFKQINIEPLVYYNMKKYSWPGNVRELENLIERWTIIFDANAVIRWEQVKGTFDCPQSGGTGDSSPFLMRTMAEITDACQKDVLLWARGEYGSVREMAEALGMDHSTIVKKAKRLGIPLSRSDSHEREK